MTFPRIPKFEMALKGKRVTSYQENPIASFMSGLVAGDGRVTVTGNKALRVPLGSPEAVLLASTSASDTATGTGVRAVLVIGIEANGKLSDPNDPDIVVMNGTTPT